MHLQANLILVRLQNFWRISVATQHFSIYLLGYSMKMSFVPRATPWSQPPHCTERDPHEPVAAQVLRPLRGRLRLLLDGRRRRVHEAAAPLARPPEEVRAHHLHRRPHGPSTATAAGVLGDGLADRVRRAVDADAAAAPAGAVPGRRRRRRGSGGRRCCWPHGWRL